MDEKRPSGLSEDDYSVWIEYTRSIKPLHREPAVSMRSPIIAKADVPPHRSPSKTAIIRPPSARDLKNVHINARLDLHGMTLDTAYKSIINFIVQSYNRGHRCVLVITGKGLSGSGDWWEDQGVLRRDVPRWLKEEPLSSKITTYAMAKPEHGGSGALYIFIKKRKVVI
jgi:dsDNA-specific endonuclease/ATPase MutS2